MRAVQNIGTEKQAHRAAGLFAETLPKSGKNSAVMPSHHSYDWQFQGDVATDVPFEGAWYSSLNPHGHLQVPHGRSEWAPIAFLGNLFYSCPIILLTGCFTFRLLRQALSVHVPHKAWLGKYLPHDAGHIRLWGSKSQALISATSHLAACFQPPLQTELIYPPSHSLPLYCSISPPHSPYFSGCRHHWMRAQRQPHHAGPA